MKTLLTSTFLLAFVLMSAASPLEKSLGELTNIDYKNQKVTINLKEAMGRVSVLVLDQNGKRLRKNTYNTQQAVTIPYDLSQLPDGDYRFKIVNRNDPVTYKVKNKKELARPLLAYGKIKDENILNLLVVGIENPGITVKIFDKNNNYIKRDVIKEKDGFSRDYRFKNIKAENLYMVVTDSEGRSKKIKFD